MSGAVERVVPARALLVLSVAGPVGLGHPADRLLQRPGGLVGVSEPAVDHRQEQPVPGAWLEDLVRLLETLQGLLVAPAR